MPNENELRLIANFYWDSGLTHSEYDVWSSTSTSNNNYVYLNLHIPNWRGASGISSINGGIPIRHNLLL